MRRSVARFLGGREGGREGRFRFFSNNFFRRSDFDFERLKMVEGRGEKGGRGGGKESTSSVLSTASVVGLSLNTSKASKQTS